MVEAGEGHAAGARRRLGQVIGGLIVAGAAGAVILTLLQWDTRPQTDDATVRANFVGITPQVSCAQPPHNYLNW